MIIEKEDLIDKHWYHVRLGIGPEVTPLQHWSTYGPPNTAWFIGPKRSVHISRIVKHLSPDDYPEYYL